MKNTITLIALLICIFSFGQKERDTLFIQYDDDLLERKQHPIKKYFYYLIDGTGNNGIVYFIEKKRVMFQTCGFYKKEFLKR